MNLVLFSLSFLLSHLFSVSSVTSVAKSLHLSVHFFEYSLCLCGKFIPRKKELARDALASRASESTCEKLSPEPTSNTTAALLASQQAEGGLRACVGLGQNRCRRGGENLASGEVGGLLGKVGVADRALGGAGVFVRHTEGVDR